MADSSGIRIHDASLEVGTESLRSLTRGEGLTAAVSRLDLTADEEALNLLLARPRSPGATPPQVTLAAGEAALTMENEGRRHTLRLRAAAVRISLVEGAVHLRTETSES